MGFKSSSFALTQTILFKRKIYSSQNRNCNSFAPPATPFNNTSFLIQLQQQRQRHRSTLTFDQYGSMENMIACCSFASSSTTSPQLNHPQPPISRSPSTSQSSNLSISEITDSLHRVQRNSSPDGSQLCDSGPQQVHSCSDGASSVPMRPKLEADDGDGVLRHRHRQCFMDDNFGTQCADSGSHTRTSIRK